MIETSWIAVDWGTSNLRAWVFGSDGQQIAQISSDKGMSSLTPDQFEPTLLALLGEHLSEDRPTPILACGMVGAAQGWTMATYAMTPCSPPGIEQAARPTTLDPRLDVRILPGVAQADPADVMRGEETQIAGLLAADPKFEGVVCLPGTHTKWARISAGRILGFATFMTGELFALLSERSVLRHSIGGAGWSDAAFAEAVAEVMARPDFLTSGLFRLRAQGLLTPVADGSARARLSGLLIGAELSGSQVFWQNQNVVILGESRLGLLYQAALNVQGAKASVADVTNMTKAGLALAYQAWKGSST